MLPPELILKIFEYLVPETKDYLYEVFFKRDRYFDFVLLSDIVNNKYDGITKFESINIDYQFVNINYKFDPFFVKNIETRYFRDISYDFSNFKNLKCVKTYTSSNHFIFPKSLDIFISYYGNTSNISEINLKELQIYNHVSVFPSSLRKLKVDGAYYNNLENLVDLKEMTMCASSHARQNFGSSIILPPNLKKLCLNCSLPKDNNLENLLKLEELEIKNYKSDIIYPPNLKKLKIIGEFICDSNSTYLKNLRELDLSECDKLYGMTYFYENLDVLYVSHNTIGYMNYKMNIKKLVVDGRLYYDKHVGNFLNVKELVLKGDINEVKCPISIEKLTLNTYYDVNINNISDLINLKEININSLSLRNIREYNFKVLNNLEIISINQGNMFNHHTYIFPSHLKKLTISGYNIESNILDISCDTVEIDISDEFYFDLPKNIKKLIISCCKKFIIIDNPIMSDIKEYLHLIK
jgi:hypothetical protein